jgi:hypothetical protein
MCGQPYYVLVLDIPETEGRDNALLTEIVNCMGQCANHPDTIEIPFMDTQSLSLKEEFL